MDHEIKPNRIYLAYGIFEKGIVKGYYIKGKYSGHMLIRETSVGVWEFCLIDIDTIQETNEVES